ncbi:BA75_02099T0 [Komagataella pastoris]|uniref:protein-serine/threonine phosphatase n=1 Tax=Komagataella pastoris TaxID=4922 RepID=A0A1B2JDV0_PICPA|nr:BA75_02099T0 [Komagataella pastoris]
MGQILSTPNVTREQSSDQDEKLYYGLSCMQGWRVSMEDAHTTILDLWKQEKNKKLGKSDYAALFGIYDGHGGDEVAKYLGAKFDEIITGAYDDNQEKGYESWLTSAFLQADRKMLSDPQAQYFTSGSTATVVLIENDTLVCANAGDSRSILSANGAVKALSFDHKPSNEGEKARIVAAGGFVDVGRVNGNLALSRAIGDFEFKRANDLPAHDQAVTALPDIIEHKITSQDEFIVLACDGIWDSLTSQQVVDIVRHYVKEGKPLDVIGSEIVDICLAPDSAGSGIGCDNMSVCIVALLQGRTIEEWYEYMKEKIPDNLINPGELHLDLYASTLADKKIWIEDLGGYSNNSDDKSSHISDDNETTGDTKDENEHVRDLIDELLNDESVRGDNGHIYLDKVNPGLLARLLRRPSQSDERPAEGTSVLKEEDTDEDESK